MVWVCSAIVRYIVALDLERNLNRLEIGFALTLLACKPVHVFTVSLSHTCVLCHHDMLSRLWLQGPLCMLLGGFTTLAPPWRTLRNSHHSSLSVLYELQSHIYAPPVQKFVGSYAAKYITVSITAGQSRYSCRTWALSRKTRGAYCC